MLSQIETFWIPFLINDYADEEEETDEPKLSEIAYLIELLECRSLFDNSGGEIRQS